MLQYYQPTPLEQWIEALWHRAGILRPDQLTIEEVSDRLDVWVHYMNASSKALEWMGIRSVLIDLRLTAERQWEDYLHELCHILRHAGNQTVMPRAFLEHQEAEAKRFVLYASMPFSMIKDIKLPAIRGEAVQLLASRFGVTCELADVRLDQFQRRAFEAVLWEEIGKMKKEPTAEAAREKNEASMPGDEPPT
ncbi:ImmA/IrrE family metallo-endopeptidase [Cohnella rhizosphaerae]|uniref:ImmA/IrrE family metallo-endopeptidase n=1 Tax=Cohnella rhizosphaerae TaxID=1457232 RepID=A0A9X4KWX1_9BACL|nr:ImmA/IrrE family metallo-endopeptidase [Cohnella rhizosphaerae]MDG0809724.1 ImmA/IrrE family metallo-endopeptidase [Cohnella rhizosphaerae]